MTTLNYNSWMPFCWYGIRMQIPAEWNPGKLVGDRKSGNVRLDDQTIPRVELEWKAAGGDERISLIVDRYVEGLEKEAKKNNQKMEVDRSATCPGLSLAEMRNTVYFTWRSQFIVHTLACYSPASDRLLFVRAMAREGEDLSELLPKLLNGLVDSGRNDRQAWSLFDLSATSPPGYELENYSLKSGHIQLKFQKGRDIFQVDRLSLAKILLRDTSLATWYRDFYRKDLRHIHVETEEEGPDDEPVLIIAGNPRGRLRGLLMPLPFWNSRPRLHLAGRAWVCGEANKIMVAQSYYRRPDDRPDLDAHARDLVPLQ